MAIIMCMDFGRHFSFFALELRRGAGAENLFGLSISYPLIALELSKASTVRSDTSSSCCCCWLGEGGAVLSGPLDDYYWW
jgi:hypothetical protein